MALDTLEVAATLKVIDQSTATIDNIVRKVRDLGAQIKTVSKESGDAFAGIFATASKQITGLNTDINTIGVAFRKSADEGVSAFQSAFSGMSAMIAAQKKEIEGLGAAWKAAGAAGGGAGVAFGRGRGGGGGGGGGPHFRTAPVPVPGGHMALGSSPMLLGAGAFAFGAYEASKLDAKAREAVLIQHAGKMPDEETTQREMNQFKQAVIGAYGATGQPIDQITEAAMKDIRQGKGYSFEQRMQVMPAFLMASAQEALLKGESMSSSADAFQALIHMNKLYDPKDMQSLIPMFQYLSLVSPQTLKRMTVAAGYHVPINSSSLGIDPAQDLAAQVVLERAGILNTKSGTWLREMAVRGIPVQYDDKGNPVGMTAKQAATRTQLLQEMGLVDEKGNSTWKDENGKFDEVKMLKILQERTKDWSPEKRTAYDRALFGAQGAGAIATLTDPKVIPQLEAITKEMEQFKQNPNVYNSMMNSSYVQGQRAWANLMTTLMDMGGTVLPPLVTGFQALNAVLQSLHALLPGGALAGGLTGALLGGKVAGVPGAVAGAAIGAGLPTIANAHLFGMPSVNDRLTELYKTNPSIAPANPTPHLDMLGNPETPTPSGKQSSLMPPPGKQSATVNVQTAVNIDSQQLAQAVTQAIANLHENSDSSFSGDGSSYLDQGGYNPGAG